MTAIRLNRMKFYKPWKEQRGDINVVVRDGSWKAIYNADYDTVELYDLSSDPGEQRDLSTSEGQRSLAMKEQASAWVEACVPATGPSGEAAALSPEAAEQLRVLGYID